MKPVAFEYEAPETLDDAVELLRRHSGDAAVLAGGQSLLPLLNFRVARPAVVVDVNRLQGLDGITRGDGGVEVGALVRAASLERSEALAGPFATVRTALRHVAHPQIRNRTTIGGSIAHADPAAELPLLLVALDGEVELVSSEGRRTLAADGFFVGPFSTARRADELVVAVRLRADGAARSGFAEVARRHGDFAVAGACALVVLADGAVASARIALCGVGPTPLRAHGAECALVGRPLDEAVLDDAAEAAREDAEPWDDVHADADYRRRLAGVVVRRALADAIGRDA